MALHLWRHCFTAHRDATRLGVRSWAHHLRAHKKMADVAANIVMDSKASMQSSAPQARPEAAEIAQHMDADVEHWFDRCQVRPVLSDG